MTNIKSQYEAERNHWIALKHKYVIYCMQGESDEIWVGDTERIIICLMRYYDKTEEQITNRLDSSNIDNPIEMNDEIFWIETK